MTAPAKPAGRTRQSVYVASRKARGDTCVGVWMDPATKAAWQKVPKGSKMQVIRSGLVAMRYLT